MKFKSKLKNIIQIILVGLQYIGFIGIFILIPYRDYIALKQDGFSYIFHPFYHSKVILNLLTVPLFWYFLALSLSGFILNYILNKNL